MRINPISDNRYQTSFQKGLTQGFVQKANKLGYKKMKNLAKAKGIETVLFDGKLSVAASCLTAAEIMQSFGLRLPRMFSFEALEDGTTGMYTYPLDVARINSNLSYFKDFDSQDSFESERLNSPITKHFLHTYIHEFMHAAHYKNLSTLHGADEIFDIAGVLKGYVPTKDIIRPQRIDNICYGSDLFWNGSALGNYASASLVEFFVENASYEIAMHLVKDKNALGENSGDNVFFNPKSKEPLTLSFLEDKKDSWWDRIFNKREVVRRNLLKAIWDGDIDTILITYGEYIRPKKD